MFPYTDPQTILELHNQHAAELRHEAEAFQLARSASAGGRHRGAGLWSRIAHRRRVVRAPVVP